MYELVTHTVYTPAHTLHTATHAHALPLPGQDALGNHLCHLPLGLGATTCLPPYLLPAAPAACRCLPTRPLPACLLPGWIVGTTCAGRWVDRRVCGQFSSGGDGQTAFLPTPGLGETETACSHTLVYLAAALTVGSVAGGALCSYLRCLKAEAPTTFLLPTHLGLGSEEVSRCTTATSMLSFYHTGQHLTFYSQYSSF